MKTRPRCVCKTPGKLRKIRGSFKTGCGAPRRGSGHVQADFSSPMTATTSTSFFHQWLLASPAKSTSAYAIVLHTADESSCEWLVQEISDYLNEYDDDGDGRWLPATAELVEKVARDPSHRQLLGLPDTGTKMSRLTTADLAAALHALGQRGHVVFRSPGLADAQLGLANAFHAGVGSRDEIPDECHVILNPEMMGRKCIAHIISDVFLEWLLCDNRQPGAVHEIR